MKNLFRILLLVSFFYCYLLLLADSNSETKNTTTRSGNALTAGVVTPSHNNEQ